MKKNTKKKSTETEVRLISPAGHRQKRFKNIALMALTCALVGCCMALPCFASSSNAELDTTLKNITAVVRDIGVAFDVIFAVWIGIKCGRGGQKLQEAKGQVAGLGVGIIMTFGADKLVQWFKGLSAFSV